MKRPASVIVPAFIAGICLAGYMPINTWWIGVGLMITSIIIFLSGNNKWVALGFVILSLLLGCFRVQQYTGTFQSDILQNFYDPQRNEMLVEGQVLDIKLLNAHHARYEVLIRHITETEQTTDHRMPVIVSVRDYEGVGNFVEPGGKIVIKNFKLIHDLRHHQEEGFLKHWRSRGFKAVLEANSKDVHSPGTDGLMRRGAYLVRKQSERVIDGLLPVPENRVLKSLFLGNQGYMDSTLKDLFTGTGTAHLVAVSGLHVGILALSLQFVLEKLGAGKPISRGLTIILVWFYAAMAGFPVSIIRAATMYTLYVLSFYTKRHYDAKSVLLWSGMGFLWLNPLSLFTVSFQLSFAAVASLLWLYPRLLSKFNWGNKPLLKLALVTMTVQLSTWPVIAWHFGTFSMVSLPANLLVVPMIGLIMPLSIIMIGTGVVLKQLSGFFALVVYGGLRYILVVITWFYQLPMAEIPVNLNHIFWYATYYAVLVLLTLKLKKSPVDHPVDHKEEVRKEMFRFE